MEILLPPNELDALTSGGARALAEDILRGWRVKSVLACLEQEAAAKVWQDRRPLHHPVLGQLDMVVMPASWVMMRQLHGEGCWRDPDFRAWFKKRSPDCRIQSRSAQIRVAVDGLRKADTGNRIVGSAGVGTGTIGGHRPPLQGGQD